MDCRTWSEERRLGNLQQRSHKYSRCLSYTFRTARKAEEMNGLLDDQNQECKETLALQLKQIAAECGRKLNAGGDEEYCGRLCRDNNTPEKIDAHDGTD